MGGLLLFLWWVIWTLTGQDPISGAHWLSFLILAAAVDVIGAGQRNRY